MTTNTALAAPLVYPATRVEAWAIRHVLGMYRTYRAAGRMRPVPAASEVRDATARYLADHVLEHGDPGEYGVALYRAGVAVHAAVIERAAIGDLTRLYHQLTLSEQFWNRGHVLAPVPDSLACDDKDRCRCGNRRDCAECMAATS